MPWLGVGSDLGQQLYGLTDGVLDEGLLHIGDLHGSGDQDDKSLQVVYEDAGLPPAECVEMIVDFGPVVAIDMQEVQFVVHDENRRVATSDLLPESRLLLEYLFEAGVVVLNVTDGLGEVVGLVVVVFVSEQPCLTDV